MSPFLVDVNFTIPPFVARLTVAPVVTHQVLTLAPVDAGVWIKIENKVTLLELLMTNITRIAFVDFFLTHFPHVSDVTLTEEVICFILARSIVFARIDLNI